MLHTNDLLWENFQKQPEKAKGRKPSQKEVSAKGPPEGRHELDQRRTNRRV